MKPKKVKKKSNNQFLWAAAMEMETFCDLVEKKTFISMKMYNLLFLSSVRSRHLTHNHAFSHHPITETLALKILSKNVIFRVSIALFSSFYVE